MSLGERIRVLRKKAGMSLEELASSSRVSRNHIHSIETGQTKPSLRILSCIADALGVTEATLISNIITDNKTDAVTAITEILEGCTYKKAGIIVKILSSINDILTDYSIT